MNPLWKENEELRAEVERLRVKLEESEVKRDEARNLADIRARVCVEAEARLAKVVEALREIAVGKVADDQDDLRVTAARLCGIARTALAAAQPPASGIGPECPRCHYHHTGECAAAQPEEEGR